MRAPKRTPGSSGDVRSRVLALPLAVVLLAAVVAGPARAIPPVTGWTCAGCWPGYVDALSECSTYLPGDASGYNSCVKWANIALKNCIFYFCDGAGHQVFFPHTVEPSSSAIFAATLGEVQDGKSIPVRWYAIGDSTAMVSIPPTVTTVEFHAVRQADFDSSMAADSSLASVPFTFLGFGAPDTAMTNQVSLVLPDIFEVDTPYLVAVLTHDSAVAPDSAQIAFVSLLVTTDPIVGVDEVRESARGGISGFPNPSRESTRIEYEIPRESPVSLAIYDVSGRMVRALVDSAVRTSGSHVATWDGRDARGQLVNSGIYFVRLDAADVRETYRIARIR